MSRIMSGSRARPVLVGLRREDPSRIWERRAPLTPDAVYNLTSSGKAEVAVVTCNRRVFSDAEYEKAGARIVKSLPNANFILGVKEPPLQEVTLSHNPNVFSHLQTTHLMFSHTAKGQEYNMPLLAQFINWAEKYGVPPDHPRLIDFELLKDVEGQRTVGFGWFAGAAGVLEAFSAMAQSHLENGVASPFLHTCRPYTLRTIEDFRSNLRLIGSMIANHGTPAALGPFIIGLTGSGKVSKGCLDMLQELPITMVRPEELENLVKSPEYNRNTIYVVHAQPSDYLRREDGGSYSREHYYQSPSSYVSVFHRRIAPYLTLFLNGAGWAPGFPRLMSERQLRLCLQTASTLPGLRFTNIADISCDIKGGLEFLTHSTTLSAPFYDIDTPGLPSVRMMSVDILPASIPFDASKHFSSALEPYLTDLIETFRTGKPGPLAEALRNATIVENGQVAEGHRKLHDKASAAWNDGRVGLAGKDVETIETWRTEKKIGKKKNILLLGSGMVAAPALDYLINVGNVNVVVVGNNEKELAILVEPYTGRVKSLLVDFSKPENCETLVKEADVVISLLPAAMHPSVAKICIECGTDMVTASYVSQEMKNLSKTAALRDVLILNEIGLDPGIDHLSAKSLLDELSRNDKEIVSFTSFCGGLPSPEVAAGVPLKYKFSWRPQGVLTAALQSAEYRLNNVRRSISPEALLSNSSYFPSVPVTSDFDLEGLPNRDSIAYISPYEIKSLPRTFVRGTLRYPGYTSLMRSFKALGLLNMEERIVLGDWSTFITQSMLAFYGVKNGVLPPLPQLVPREDLQPLRDALKWLGLAKPAMLHPNPTPMPAVPTGWNYPLDVFAYLLAKKLKYAPGEQDMVVLSHEIISRSPTQPLDEVHTSTLITYGTDLPHTGFSGERPASAMARTVGLPVAIAAVLVAEGDISLKGVMTPMHSLIYDKILRRLSKMGLSMVESTRKVARGDENDGTVERALIAARGWSDPVKGVFPNLRDIDSDPMWKEEEPIEVLREERVTGLDM